MKIKTIPAAIVLICLVAACTTPARLYNHGDYYRATMASVKRLRTKPDDTKVQEILQKSYPMAISNLQSSIDKLQLSGDPDKYYSIVKMYNMLNAMANEIERCPKAAELIPEPTDFTQEAETAREAGAEAFYRLGVEALDRNSVEGARKALYFFDNVDNFVKSYKDLDSLMAEAKMGSILKVLVRRPITPLRYRLSSDFFFDNLLEGLNYANYHNKVEFLEEETKDPEYAHQTIILDFADFTIGNTRETKYITDCIRDSVIIDYTNIRGERIPIYGTVRAQYIEVHSEVVSAGLLEVKIINNKNKQPIIQRRFPGEYVWISVWGYYVGDMRALTPEQIEVCRLGRELPPSDQELFIEFTKPIYNRTIDFLTNYYYNY